MKKLKRSLYILKCRSRVKMYRMIERVLHTLSTWGIIVEHEKHYNQVFDIGSVQTAPDIKSERFIFSVSFILRTIEVCDEHWFETKSGRKIYVLLDDRHEETRISYRADLKSFFCHFSHKNRMWVHSTSPKVALETDPHSFMYWNRDKVKMYKTHTCDFSKCRYALEVNLSKDRPCIPSEEVLSESYRVLGNSLTSKIPEINKTLTGAENDGNMTSPSNCPLADNLVCRKCGYPVFATPTGRHIYECIHHGEVDYRDVDRVDPKTYEVILSNCMFELERFCECPQD